VLPVDFWAGTLLADPCCALAAGEIKEIAISAPVAANHAQRISVKRSIRRLLVHGEAHDGLKVTTKTRTKQSPARSGTSIIFDHHL